MAYMQHTTGYQSVFSTTGNPDHKRKAIRMAHVNISPNQKELQRLFRYDPETGIIYRKWPTRGEKATGCPNSEGYLLISVNGHNYSAHRLIWMYLYGTWPKDTIDHINGIRSDNRLCNLRACTQQQNVCNMKGHPRNTSGYKGVTLVNGKWKAGIKANGKAIYIGSFVKKEDAARAYNDKAIQYFGEFAKLNIINTEL